VETSRLHRVTFSGAWHLKCCTVGVMEKQRATPPKQSTGKDNSRKTTKMDTPVNVDDAQLDGITDERAFEGAQESKFKSEPGHDSSDKSGRGVHETKRLNR
jgi:hypothetical protein